MKYLFISLIILIFINACKEKYESPYESPDTGYLVVEGVINSGQGNTTIKLSRTGKLDETNITHESGARITIEGEDNSVYNLPENISGSYTASNLNLNSDLQYRLKINTTNGKEYVSDFVPVVYNPPIDSISWKLENDGVQLYVETHNPLNNTRYYQWEYIETWKFVSEYPSYLDLKSEILPDGSTIYFVVAKDPVTFLQDTTIYTCWQSDTSNTLILGSSAKLSEDVIHLPVAFVPPGSKKMNNMYSINVMQSALTKEAYEFLEKMKKNTESLGTIFDPQPSQLKGNIHCVNDPSEPVIGFVNISNFQEKRVFIYKSEIPDWYYQPDCKPIEIPNISDSIYYFSQGRYPAYISLAGIGPNPDIILFAEKKCIDCTLTGTNIKPVFWP